MRWTSAIHLVALPALIASLAACDGSVDSDTSAASGPTTGTGHEGTGGAGTGSNAGGGPATTSTGSTAHGGGPTTTTTTTSSTGGSEVYPAPHPAPVQVISLGGPVMTSQKIVPVFFGNDDGSFKLQIQDFLAKIETSTYFASAATEYGVGPATLLPAIELGESAQSSLSDTDVTDWLTAKIEAGDGVFPQPDNETIYVVFYPEDTTIQLGGFGSSCQAFGGYHADTQLHDGTSVIYAVIPRCPASQGVSKMDNVSDSTSHELLEAATDPLPYAAPAYGATDDEHFYVQFVLLGEIGDLCAFSPSGYTTYPDLPYTVQRVYSNQSALAGHNPCIPIPSGEVYFAAADNPQDDLQFGQPGNTVTVKGTQIPLGASKDVEVLLFSDGPHEPWDVVAYDSQALYGGAPELDFAFGSGGSSGRNGDKLTMSIKVLKRGQYGIETFLLYSISGAEMNVWAGFVYTP